MRELRYPGIFQVVAKVLVSFEDRLLERIDAEAKRRGLSPCALLSQFAAKELGVALGPGASPEVHEAMRRLDTLCFVTPAMPTIATQPSLFARCVIAGDRMRA